MVYVVNATDCIGCLSCAYACPSQCILVEEIELIRPFHRIMENVAFVEQFLCVQSITKDLSPEEIEWAYNEIGILLSAFSNVIEEVLGRGHKTVGRRAGNLAAIHLPEMYEKVEIEELLEGIHRRFGDGFNFNCRRENNNTIHLNTKPCGLLKAVLDAGEQPGDSALCLLYHEYWAGLISSFSDRPYTYEVLRTGKECILKLEPSN
jgi:hypothetical protein